MVIVYFVIPNIVSMHEQHSGTAVFYTNTNYYSFLPLSLCLFLKGALIVFVYNLTMAEHLVKPFVYTSQGSEIGLLAK